MNTNFRVLLCLGAAALTLQQSTMGMPGEVDTQASDPIETTEADNYELRTVGSESGFDSLINEIEKKYGNEAWKNVLLWETNMQLKKSFGNNQVLVTQAKSIIDQASNTLNQRNSNKTVRRFMYTCRDIVAYRDTPIARLAMFRILSSILAVLEHRAKIHHFAQLTSSANSSTPSANGSAPSANGSAPSANGSAPSANGSAPSANGSAPSANGSAPSANGPAPSADGSARRSGSIFYNLFHRSQEQAQAGEQPHRGGAIHN